jgi:hypothetical protein
MFRALIFYEQRGAQLYKTTTQPFYHPQYVELSEVPQCLIIEMEIVYGNWSSLIWNASYKNVRTRSACK